MSPGRHGELHKDQQTTSFLRLVFWTPSNYGKYTIRNSNFEEFIGEFLHYAVSDTNPGKRFPL